jgi:hypothetical protein
MGLLESQSCDEIQLVTCGEGDGIVNKVIPISTFSSVSVSHFSIILIPVSKFGIPTLATNVIVSATAEVIVPQYHPGLDFKKHLRILN